MAQNPEIKAPKKTGVGSLVKRAVRFAVRLVKPPLSKEEIDAMNQWNDQHDPPWYDPHRRDP